MDQKAEKETEKEKDAWTCGKGILFFPWYLDYSNCCNTACNVALDIRTVTGLIENKDEELLKE